MTRRSLSGLAQRSADALRDAGLVAASLSRTGVVTHAGYLVEDLSDGTVRVTYVATSLPPNARLVFNITETCAQVLEKAGLTVDIALGMNQLPHLSITSPPPSAQALTA
ncbi:peptide ligase PGM1-related protein [Kitasatospora viridis]|uniref:PGM1 C-terminal domain-containing protein n=1 Tax=Kitasatospora viridis TaxID=281105 RepID=A0A561SA20_9ACTN|nr:peptide ligase PGM1-related protein [Kitasatospora viridis]TWF71697.1 hypothetical protein FHX73_1868 [Kitasatospora viridis]